MLCASGSCPKANQDTKTVSVRFRPKRLFLFLSSGQTIGDSVGHQRSTTKKVCTNKQTDRNMTIFYPQNSTGSLKESEGSILVLPFLAVIEAVVLGLRYVSTQSLNIFSLLKGYLGL